MTTTDSTTEPSGYTTHGYWYGPGEPDLPFPMAQAKCGGPGMCRQCAREAGTPLPPFRRETDLRRAGVASPITADDMLLVNRVLNPDRSDLEKAIRADERRIVAEEIAAAIEAKAEETRAESWQPSAGIALAALVAVGADIARKHREEQA